MMNIIRSLNDNDVKDEDIAKIKRGEVIIDPFNLLVMMELD
jgi:hypothetical protein